MYFTDNLEDFLACSLAVSVKSANFWFGFGFSFCQPRTLL